MPTPETGQAPFCEQCGAPLLNDSAELGCVHCLLRAGMESAEAATLSPTDFGTRNYQHYEVLAHSDGSPWELGRGAMGVTYKAVDVNLRMPVALKVVNGRFSVRPGANRRFLGEAQAAAKLRHPNVASVFHFGWVNTLPDEKDAESGDCFYAMEFLEGETLDVRVRRVGALAPGLVLEIGLQVARAMVAAEKQGLVHRDLKPSNIMLVAGEEPGVDSARRRAGEAWVKVIDFGLAQVGSEDNGVSSGEFLGTPQFASPEQRAGQPPDMRSDIYSLGATLWFALCAQVYRGDPAILRNRAVPEPLIKLLESMLSADPQDRPATAAAMSEALEECRETIAGSRVATVARPASRARVFAVLAAACLLAMLIGAVLYFRGTDASLGDKSIAVLPFKNLSGDPRNDVLAEGIEDDLLSSLVKIRDLKVIGRQSTAHYLGNAARNVQVIGRELGVRHVLRGSLRRSGNRVLLEVALLDTRDGYALWGERYDRTMTDAISLQGELASAIVDALDATLSPQEAVDLRAKPTRNPDAYVLYLRARKYEHGAVAAIANYEAAARLFEQALALDPGFAQAHAGLASQLALLYRFREPSEELRRRAHAEADEALRLQPALGEAWLAKGECFYHIERDFARALPKFEHARRLLPNDPEPESFLAYIHRRQGKWREARAELEKVAAREPNALNYEEELFATSTLLRDWDSTARHGDRLLLLAPNLPQVKIERAYLEIWRSGDLTSVEKAFAGYSDYGDPEGDLTWARWDAAMIARHYAQAQAALAQFPSEMMTSVFGAPLPKSYLEGCTALAQGEVDRAQLLFETARPSMEAEAIAHPVNAMRHSRLGLLYAYMGRKADALREGERAVELLPSSRDAYEGPERMCDLALIQARVGESERALDLIESLLRKPGCVSFYQASLSLAELRLRWQWDPLRANPRFQRLLAGPEPITIY